MLIHVQFAQQATLGIHVLAALLDIMLMHQEPAIVALMLILIA